MNDFVKPEELTVISEADAADLQRRGVLATNPDRSLPLWFDGRFLTARDLNRQQSYFLSRHGALGRTIGSGVIEGLHVAIDSHEGRQDTIRIEPGQGIAFDGAHIHLPEQMTLQLSDVAVQTALNAQLGLSAHPSAPLHSRSGLFVLSLRPVEYTANQTSSFPSTVTGERTVHMGDKIEAVAATLTPYAPTSSAMNSSDARADAAMRIFAHGKIDGMPAYALPVAMISMRYGVVEWVDVHLVRRELVAAKREFLGLGLSQDQLRLAHFEQYRTALADVMDHYASSGQPARFPAEQHFKLLPAAGPMPADAVDPAAMAQVFFPGEVEVELSVIPDDELATLIEESFDLPPIDLTQPVEERDTLSVMIVAPMPRHALRSQLTSLQELSKPLRPLSMLGQGPQRPIERLGAMKISLADAAARRAPMESVAAQEWASVVDALTNFGLEGNSARRTLWYMRRRTLRRSADLESVLVAVGNVDPADDGDVPSPTEPVVDPAPEPTPTPTPAPDKLPEEVRAALIKMSGYGEMAKIAEVQMRRVSEAIQKIFAEAVLKTPVADDAISATAVVARMSDGGSNARTQFEKNVKSILSANEKGRAVLSAGLIGEGSKEVSAKRFEQLHIFLTKDELFEGFANALPKLKTGQQTDLTLKLGELTEIGDESGIVDLTKHAIKLAKEADQPTPAPTPTPGPAPDPATDAAAKREKEVQLAVDKLVKELPHKPDQTLLKKALAKGTLAQREDIVGSMTKAKVSGSRIATAAALNALATGGALTTSHIRRVKAIDGQFVAGIGALEPGLLKVEKPAAQPPTRNTARRGRNANLRELSRASLTERTLGARVNDRNLSALIGGGGVNSAERRIALLGQAKMLGQLAKFGAANRGKAAKLKPVIKDVVDALDKANARVSSVDTAIQASLKRNS